MGLLSLLFQTRQRLSLTWKLFCKYLLGVSYAQVSSYESFSLAFCIAVRISPCHLPSAHFQVKKGSLSVVKLQCKFGVSDGKQLAQMKQLQNLTAQYYMPKSPRLQEIRFSAHLKSSLNFPSYIDTNLVSKPYIYLILYFPPNPFNTQFDWDSNSLFLESLVYLFMEHTMIYKLQFLYPYIHLSWQ